MALVTIKAAGPVYWAKEYGAEGGTVSLPWMREMEPPYRYGRAVRIRVKQRAIQIGVCRKNPTGNDLRRDLDTPVDDIREWH